MLIVYFVLLVADVISTLACGQEVISYLEVNPLYKYGGFVLISALNLLLMYLFYRMYTKTENINLRFYILFVLVSVMTTRCLAIYGNTQIALNPPTIEYLKSIGTAQLQQMKVETMKQMMVLNLLPFINGAITWIMFSNDHKVIKNE